MAGRFGIVGLLIFAGAGCAGSETVGEPAGAIDSGSTEPAADSSGAAETDSAEAPPDAAGPGDGEVSETPADGGAAGDLLPSDLPPSEVAADAETSPGAGAFGAPCESADDCFSGFCVLSHLGLVCSKTCDDTCPDGWTCAQDLGSGADLAFVCLPAFASLCLPCFDSADCGPAARCVSFGDEGSFCGGACDEVPCPAGHTCVSAADLEGGTSLQCLPEAGICGCTPPAIAAGAETACHVVNDFGSCPGFRGCSEDGLGPCVGPTPAEETCDGADEDCDGEVDEGFGDLDADGLPDCTDPDADGDGVLPPADCAPLDPAVHPGAPEACDGRDGDCDGVPDDGFPDLDGDGAADCVDPDDDGDGEEDEEDLCPQTADVDPVDTDGDGLGDACDPDDDGDGDPDGADCAPLDPAVGPSSAESCNGQDDDCDGEIDPVGSFGCTPYWRDLDGDGWGGTEKAPKCLCGPDEDSDYTAPNYPDCDDLDETTHPDAPELCNGWDDDCDKSKDEGWTEKGKPCDGPDADLCVDGKLACSDGGLACSEKGAGKFESCNTQDDDCDGAVDEGFGVGDACDSDDADLCPLGALKCLAAGIGLVCAESKHLAETCNGGDDDCDGASDEGFGVGESCDSGDDDLCVHGVVICDGAGGAACDEDLTDLLEVCEGTDEDCDGAVDEGFGVGLPCDSEDSDLCEHGVWTCDGAGGVGCPEAPSDLGELCNGEDDDCDGGTDEGFGLGEACDAGDEDLCEDGAWACDEDGGVSCAEPGPGVVETCNGEDDDCDGAADEGFPKGEPCDSDDADLCANGVFVCSQDGGVECPESVADLAETCDGEDEDCDGDADEGFPKGEPCDSADSDLCEHGLWTCDGAGGLACPEDVTDLPDLCDGADEDCDGSVDEGFPLGDPCDSFDSDLCANGHWTCDGAGGLACPEDVTDLAETCNHDDDDCDVEADEDFPLWGLDCDSPEDEDLCATGFWTCTADGAGVECANEDDPFRVEACNGQDDDCDGGTDEDFPEKGLPCDTGDADLCELGTWSCTAAGDALECPGEVVSGLVDTCNGEDDDCDGETDEEFPLKAQPCDGPDADLCAHGVWACAAGGLSLVCPSETLTDLAEVCGGGDEDCDGQTDEGCSGPGCADGEREGFLDAAAWPQIAACAGGFTVPGIIGTSTSPQCARQAGDDSPNPTGQGCGVTDLCAEGWHVCATSAEVASRSPTGCDGAAPNPDGPSAPAFYATRQGSTGCAVCATGSAVGGGCSSPASCATGCAMNDALTNDVFGCGTLGASPNPSCAPLTAFSNDQCVSLAAPWSCGTNGYEEAKNLVKPGAEKGGVLCCQDL